MFYQNLVFIQGEESGEYLDVLYNWTGDEFHVHYQGTWAESIDATFGRMIADFGEFDGAEITEEPASGSGDDSWEQDGYRLSAHLGLSYIGLERLVRDAQGTPVWMPPAEYDIADAHGGFTAVTKTNDWGHEETLWRPGTIAKRGTTGTRIPGTVRHDAQYQNEHPVISALYRIPGYRYKVRVWFDQEGQRIA